MHQINIIAIKDMIISEKAGEKEEQLVIGNAIEQAKVVKMSNPINLNSKYIWAVSNTDIDTARDLRLTDVKKYQRRTGQIKKEVNRLHKDYILALATFVKYFRRTHNNEKVTGNMRIRLEVDHEQA